MNAIFKENDKLVLNSADNNEQLILQRFISKANDNKYDIFFNKLLDINGNTSGMSIELREKEPEPSAPEE